MDKNLEKTISKDDFITNYNVARSIADQAVVAYESKWKLIEACQNHVKGERPVKPEILRKKGLGWSSNDNLLKARSQVEKAVQKNTAKMSNAIALGYPTFRAPEDKDKGSPLDFLNDEAKRGVVASALGYAFSNTLGKEHRLSGMLVQIEYPTYSFGYVTAIHIEGDWVPDIIHPLDIAFRPQTDPNDITEFVVFKTVSAKYLWERWEECRNQAEKKVEGENNEVDQIFASNGWSKTALEELLWRIYNGKQLGDENKRVETWQQVYDRFNFDHYDVLSNSEDVTLAKIYYKELDGTFTSVYIPYDSTRKANQPFKGFNNNPNQTVDLILFKKQYKEKVKERVNLIRNNAFTETSYIEDFTGLLKYAVLDSMRYNTLVNDTFNKLRFSGSPFFEQSSKIQGETFKIGVQAGFIVTPVGFPLAPVQPQFDIQPQLTMMRVMKGEYMESTDQFDATLTGRLSSRPNKDEVRAQQSEVQSLNESTNTIRFGDYSAMFFQMLRNLVGINVNSKSEAYDGIDRFYKQVMKLIPSIAKTKEDVKKIVEAVDSYVIDSVSSDTGAIMLAIQLSETPFARNRYKRMLMLANGFPIEEVNIAIPLASDKLSNFQDERIALFENDMFWTTNEVIVQGTDDQIIHLNTHLAKAQRTVDAYSQGRLSPDQAFKYLENNLAHSLQHLELLLKDPVLSKEAEQYRGAISELNKAKSQMMLAAQKMMDEQMRKQQEVQLDPKTQADIARKNAESQTKQQRAGEQSNNRHEQAMYEIGLKHQREIYELQLSNQTEQTALANEQTLDSTANPQS